MYLPIFVFTFTLCMLSFKGMLCETNLSSEFKKYALKFILTLQIIF